MFYRYRKLRLCSQCAIFMRLLLPEAHSVFQIKKGLPTGSPSYEGSKSCKMITHYPKRHDINYVICHDIIFGNITGKHCARR